MKVIQKRKRGLKDNLKNIEIIMKTKEELCSASYERKKLKIKIFSSSIN